MKNGTRLYAKKAESQQLFLDFIDEPKDSSRRNQQGVYTSYVYGKPGNRIKIILLDLRYNADEPGPESDILGEKQWQWLENELRDSKDDIVLLGSSIQLLSCEHPYEHWGNYPKSRKRILQLLSMAKPRLAVVLSGDRHLAEISGLDNQALSFPLNEITSSGLTHHVDFFYHLRGLFSPEHDEYRLGDLFYESNFGAIDIDLSQTSPDLNLQIRDQENHIKRQVLIETKHIG